MYTDDGEVKCLMCGRDETGTRAPTALDHKQNRRQSKENGHRKLNAQDQRWVLGLDAHIEVPNELYGEIDNVEVGL